MRYVVAELKLFRSLSSKRKKNRKVITLKYKKKLWLIRDIIQNVQFRHCLWQICPKVVKAQHSRGEGATSRFVLNVWKGFNIIKWNINIFKAQYFKADWQTTLASALFSPFLRQKVAAEKLSGWREFYYFLYKHFLECRHSSSRSQAGRFYIYSAPVLLDLRR